MCGNISYVFSAQEALDEERWKAALRSSKGLKVRAVFCDEAHCIEMWGGGVEPFRQSYAKIASLQSFLLSNVPFVALTATATTATISSIRKSLNMIDPVIISTSSNRINLRYSVICVDKNVRKRFTWLLEDLQLVTHCTTSCCHVIFHLLEGVCRSIASAAHVCIAFLQMPNAQLRNLYYYLSNCRQLARNRQ